VGECSRDIPFRVLLRIVFRNQRRTGIEQFV
jgi:hypothetical protein